MPMITWTVETNAGTVTQDFVLSTPDMIRFTDWAWVTYPQYEPDGVTLKPKSNANVGDAVKDWMTGLANGTAANVENHERNAVAQIARAGVGVFGL